MTTAVLTSLSNQPVTGPVAKLSVDVSGLPSGLMGAYAVVEATVPGFAFEMGIGVASLMYRPNPQDVYAYLFAGPGTYTMRLKVNTFDQAGHFTSVFGDPITVQAA